MLTSHESVCCTEIGQVWQKVEEQRPETQLSCITEHPGFQSTCLDFWVLETAYYTYRRFTAHYGTARYGTARYGTARYGTARYSTVNHTENE